MPSVFRKQTTSWRMNGAKVPAGTPGAEPATVYSRRWYGTVAGKQVPLSPDKAVAERLLRKRLADADLDRAGLADPFGPHRRRPLADHAAALEAKGDTPAHVRQTVARVRAVFAGCGFVLPADLDAGRAVEWLAGKRRDGAGPAVPPGAQFTPAQAAAVLGVSGAGLRAALARHGLPASGSGKARQLTPGHRRAAGGVAGPGLVAGDVEPPRPGGARVLPLVGQGEAAAAPPARRPRTGRNCG